MKDFTNAKCIFQPNTSMMFCSNNLHIIGTCSRMNHANISLIALHSLFNF